MAAEAVLLICGVPSDPDLGWVMELSKMAPDGCLLYTEDAVMYILLNQRHGFLGRSSTDAMRCLSELQAHGISSFLLQRELVS